MGNQSISDNEREKVPRRLRKGDTDSSKKIAAEIGVRERSVAGVKSWYTNGRYSRKRGMPRAQRSKRYTSKAASLSKKKALLRKMVLRERAIQKTLRSVYVRDPNARQQCIDKHGPISAAAVNI